jgi:hypothetical protein
MMTSFSNRLRVLVVSLAGLFIMIMFSACGGVATSTNAPNSVTGTVQSVNAADHSVTLNVGGQQVKVSGLTDAQISALQSQLGKNYTVQVTSTGSNAYNINSGTDPQAVNENTSAATTTTNGPQNTGTPQGISQPGTIQFVGKVQSINASSITVVMPNGDAIPMSLGVQTDRTDFANGQPGVNQQIKAEAASNANGSFTATKLSVLKTDDQTDQVKLNTVDFSGVTTSAVGSDNVVHFQVGNKSYNFTAGASTQLKHLASAQSIVANQPIKVEVIYNGASNTLTKLETDN